MKFLADENFPRPALLLWRDAGNDVRSVAEENPGLSDEAVAEICELDARVLLTFDKDFGELIFRRGLPARRGHRFIPIGSGVAGRGCHDPPFINGDWSSRRRSLLRGQS
jgi:Domain of unknown function (DUF5615)